ncbi:helix-turn-helix transcriptional regulator [Dyadobacter aurulentus]|uniref:helix-turn-helix transcriptional regulator n=1 Tax=Dyadobacter sp. UC 10 TaxID=2605428 RepID=UPI0011F3F240|nr:helix-turn-helix domain-containing protein [Dyadobacter sp. UC 10]KAA0992412.1 helix-turn-helix domain-containing protein [Dyadobacter sp. UC 10]
MKVLSLHLKNFFDYARLRGLTKSDQAYFESKLPPDWAAEQTMIERAAFCDALAVLRQAVGDPYLGVKAGNFMALKLLGAIYQISLQTNTVEEAFHYLQSYMEATFPMIRARTAISGDSASVILTIEEGNTDLDRIILENVLTIISRELQMMAGKITNLTITSPFVDENYPSGWEQGTGFSVSFDSIILKASLKDVNQLRLDILIPEYLKMISQLDTTDKFSDKVRITMLSMSDPELPDIDSVCDVMCLTARTLQRKLLKEEITYRKITEDLKKQICSFLILHEPYPIASLSYILGYSEPASFIHSFKKWYGNSPHKVRKALLAAG